MMVIVKNTFQKFVIAMTVVMEIAAHGKIFSRKTQHKLRKIQRLSFVDITRAMHSTPTAANFYLLYNSIMRKEGRL